MKYRRINGPLVLLVVMFGAILLDWVLITNANVAWCTADEKTLAPCLRNWLNSVGNLFAFFGAAAAAIFAWLQIRHVRRQADLALIPLLQERVARLNRIDSTAKVVGRYGDMVRRMLAPLLVVPMAELGANWGTQIGTYIDSLHAFMKNADLGPELNNPFDRAALKSLSRFIDLLEESRRAIEFFLIFSAAKDDDEQQIYIGWDLRSLAVSIAESRELIFEKLTETWGAAKEVELEVGRLLASYGREFLRVEGLHVQEDAAGQPASGPVLPEV